MKGPLRGTRHQNAGWLYRTLGRTCPRACLYTWTPQLTAHLPPTGSVWASCRSWPEVAAPEMGSSTTVRNEWLKPRDLPTGCQVVTYGLPGPTLTSTHHHPQPPTNHHQPPTRRSFIETTQAKPITIRSIHAPKPQTQEKGNYYVKSCSQLTLHFIIFFYQILPKNEFMKYLVHELIWLSGYRTLGQSLNLCTHLPERVRQNPTHPVAHYCVHYHVSVSSKVFSIPVS